VSTPPRKSRPSGASRSVEAPGSPRALGSPRFAAVVLDVDSTLAGIEGIDWLAQRREPTVATAIAELTERAMRGDLPLEAVYGGRLARIGPTADEIAALTEAYRAALAPGARSCIGALRTAGVRIALVSGGIRQAILPLAAELGIPEHDVRAVELRFDSEGRYGGFRASPLVTHTGKHLVIETLELAHPVLGVGDGATDVHMRPAVDVFAAYVGWVRRDPVIQAADHVLDSFHALQMLVLG